MVLPYAGSCLAVDGFSFLGGNDVSRSGKPKYGGVFRRELNTAVIFWRKAVLRFSVVTTFAEAVNQNMAVFFRRELDTVIVFWR